MDQPLRIVLTGGPGGGKTTAAEAIDIDTRLRALWSKHPRFHLVPHNRSFLRKVTVGLAILESVVAHHHTRADEERR